MSWLTPTEILDGIQVGDYNKMDYGNSNVAGKMRRSDGRTDDKEYDGIWRCEICEDNRKFTVEMKSVNHRYLDVNLRMPKKLISSKLRSAIF